MGRVCEPDRSRRAGVTGAHYKVAEENFKSEHGNFDLALPNMGPAIVRDDVNGLALSDFRTEGGQCMTHVSHVR